jgi:hypothetical protein
MHEPVYMKECFAEPCPMYVHRYVCPLDLPADARLQLGKCAILHWSCSAEQYVIIVTEDALVTPAKTGMMRVAHLDGKRLENRHSASSISINFEALLRGIARELRRRFFPE